MTSSMFVLLSCLLLASQGLADMDNNQQMEEMISKMMAAKMGELRVEVQERDKAMEEMRDKMEKGEEMRQEMLEKMKVVMEDMEEKVEMMREEMEVKDNQLKKQLGVLETKNAELTTKLKEVDQKSLRDLPYVMSCAYRRSWTTPSATITYERRSADYNNSDRPGGGDGDMDISTGKFTALTAGHYTVTYSGHVYMHPGEDVQFQLMHNDQSSGDEGRWHSYSSSSNGGNSDDQGSRTVVSV